MQLTGPQKTAILLLAGYSLFLATANPWIEAIFRNEIQQGESAFISGLLHSGLEAMFSAQFAILAFLAALATARLSFRLPTALAFATALLLVESYVEKMVADTQPERLQFNLLVAVGYLGLFPLLYQLKRLCIFGILYWLLTMARAKFGWRIVSDTPQAEPSRLRERQFTISDLFFWTAYVAVTLGLGLWIFEPSSNWLRREFLLPMMPLLFSLIVELIFNYVPLLLALAAVTDKTHRKRWLTIAVRYILILVGISILLRFVALGFGSGSVVGAILIGPFYYCLHLCTLCAGAGISLAILASGGWRPTRLEPSAVSVAADSVLQSESLAARDVSLSAEDEPEPPPR